jgi:hypothetical protein
MKMPYPRRASLAILLIAPIKFRETGRKCLTLLACKRNSG